MIGSERITIDTDVCHGEPCVRGLRYPVTMILDLLGSGMTAQDILVDYPYLADEDITAALKYAPPGLRERAGPLASKN